MAPDRAGAIFTGVRAKDKPVLPIGRAARVAGQLDELRSECCRAAEVMTATMDFDEDELDECARLDEALAAAQRLLKSSVARIILARLRRRSRAGNSDC